MRRREVVLPETDSGATDSPRTVHRLRTHGGAAVGVVLTSLLRTATLARSAAISTVVQPPLRSRAARQAGVV